MTSSERDQLFQEMEILKMLLDFHLKHRERIGMTDLEFETYSNAVLDRLLEIKKLLDDLLNEEEASW